MSKKSGATNPTTERAAQPRLSLPPERQLHTTLVFEGAVYDALAMLDLLAHRLVDEARGDDITYNPPPTLAAIFCVAQGTGLRLREAFEEHLAEVRRMQFAGLEPRDETRN